MDGQFFIQFYNTNFNVFTGTFNVLFVVAVRHGRVVNIPTSDSEGLGFASRSGSGHT